MYIGNPFLLYGATYENTYSLDFDGVDESVNIGRVTEAEGATNYSYSFWVKMTSTAAAKAIMGKAPAANDTLYIYKLATSDYLFAKMGGTNSGSPSNGQVTTTTALTFGSWVNVCVVFDGSLTGNTNRLKIYMGGTLAGTTGSGTVPDTLSSNTGDFAYGALVSSALAKYIGKIDEVAIFDYSLTSAQVTSIYNGGVAGDLMDTSGLTQPIHYYRNGDTSGDDETIINDIGSAGGNDGTPTNMEAGDVVADAP